MFKARRHIVGLLVKKGEIQEMSLVYNKLLETIPKVTSEWRADWFNSFIHCHSV